MYDSLRRVKYELRKKCNIYLLGKNVININMLEQDQTVSDDLDTAHMIFDYFT